MLQSEWDEFMGDSTANPGRFFAGLIGFPLCTFAWLRTHNTAWAAGIAASVALLTWSIAEAVVATRRDIRWMQDHRKSLESSRSPNPETVDAVKPKPLRQDNYFRAGIIGLPFCIFEWFWKHDMVFLLGSGFFAGLLVPSLYKRWKRKRQQH